MTGLYRKIKLNNKIMKVKILFSVEHLQEDFGIEFE